VLQGNCSGPPPSLTDLDISSPETFPEVLPGQCVFIMAGTPGNLVLQSTATWIEGIVFGMRRKTLQLPHNVWVERSTFVWGEAEGGEEIDSGAFNVLGRLYMQGASTPSGHRVHFIFSGALCSTFRGCGLIRCGIFLCIRQPQG
jgi:hypothetical protein